MTELRPVDFSREHLPHVRDFVCGTEEWAEWAARWIKDAPPFPSALLSMEKRGTSVWVYYLDVEVLGDQYLVGFASLGETSCPPSNNKVQFIPMLAVASSFQGKAQRFSHQIMEHVISQAREREPAHLCLTVHPDNLRAIRLYKRFGFCCVGEKNGYGNLRMCKKLK